MRTIPCRDPGADLLLTREEHGAEFYQRYRDIHLAKRKASAVLLFEKEDILIGDKCVSTRSTGSQLVYDEDFGPVPIDDEEARTSDGRRIVRIDTHTHESGRTVRREIVLFEGGDLRESSCVPIIPAKGDRRPDTQAVEKARSCMLADVAEAQKLRAGEIGEWVVVLRDDEPMETVPPSYIGGAALRACGREDQVGSMRRERIARNVARREVWAAEFLEIARKHNFDGEIESSRHRLCVRIRGNVTQLADVLQFRLAHEIDPVGSGVPDWGGSVLSETYMCEADPNRFDSTIDDHGDADARCKSGETPFLDAVNKATGFEPFLNWGWTGGGETAEGGLAAWAAELDGDDYKLTPHLVLGVKVVHKSFSPQHAGFTKASDGLYRFKWGTTGSHTGTNMYEFDPQDSTHDTKCAAIAMSDITRDQDPQVSSPTAQSARSGIARDAFGVFADNRLGSCSDRFGRADYPPDMITSSISENCGIGFVRNGDGSLTDTQCVTPKEARGVDSNSVGVLDAFNYDGVVTFKSAGNIHGKGFQDCWGGLFGIDSDVTTPGASPATISVGALHSDASADQMQVEERVSSESSGRTTLDGRSYPSLVVSHWQCGAASRYSSQDHDSYGIMGATSGATPRVAGGALVFKHWYLDAHGPTLANAPGRLMVHVLNMADGFARTDRGDGSGFVTTAPEHGYGLGRFSARLFNSHGMAGAWGRGCASASVELGDEPWILDLGAGLPDGEVPRNRRFVGTLWWLEVNTGEGEAKALLQVTLSSEHAVDYRFGLTDPVIRFQYDCLSSVYTQRWHGKLQLTVTPAWTPKEVRGRKRTSRTVYFAWYYETEDWVENILCEGQSGSCHSIKAEIPRGSAFDPPADSDPRIDLHPRSKPDHPLDDPPGHTLEDPPDLPHTVRTI